MNAIAELFRLQLDDKVRWLKRRDAKTAFKFVVKYLIILPVITALLTLAFLYFERVGLAFNGDMLAVLLGVTQIIAFFLSIGSIVSNMYLSKDNELLLSFPARPEQVFLSKILLLLVLELESNLVFTLPLLISFGIVAGVSAAYWVLIPIFLLLLPLIPFAAAALLSLPYMLLRYFLRRRPRLAIAVTGGAVAVLFALYMFLVLKIVGSFDLIGHQFQIMVFVNDLVETLARYSFIFKVMADAMLIGPYWFVKLPALLLTCILLFVLGALAVKPLYFKLAVKSVETSPRMAKKRRPSSDESAFLSLIKREFRIMFRAPQTIFSYFLFTLLMPFMVLVYDRMLATVVVGGSGPILVGASHLLVACILGTLSNLYSAVSVSLEGSRFYLGKTCPVPYRTQALAKICFNGLLTGAAVLVTAALVVIFTDIAVWRLALCTLIVLIASFGHLLLSFTLDIRRPLLDWFDSGEITKLSRSTALSLLTGVLISLLLFGIVFLFATFLRGWEVTAYLTALFAAALFAGVAALIFFKNVDRFYTRAGA